MCGITLCFSPHRHSPSDSLLEMANKPTSQPQSVASFRYCGLNNLNKCCYSNACLQVLYTLNKTRNYLMDTPHCGQFHSILSELFRQMAQQPLIPSANGKLHFYPAISPIKFNSLFRLLRPEFVRGQEQDAEEFLIFLLDVLHQESNVARRRPNPSTTGTPQSAQEAWQHHTTFIDDSTLSRIFMGQIESLLTCLSCGHQSYTWSCFWQLQLDIPTMAKVPTISDCIRQFMAEEVSNEYLMNLHECWLNRFCSLYLQTLIADAAPTCYGCAQKLGSGKKQTIRHGPVYLIVHLKRFSANGQKIHSKVTFEERILLANRYYQLSSCVLHCGTAESGHYMTIYWESANKWVLFDDSVVSFYYNDDQAREFLELYGYIAFYRALVITWTSLPIQMWQIK